MRRTVAFVIGVLVFAIGVLAFAIAKQRTAPSPLSPHIMSTVRPNTPPYTPIVRDSPMPRPLPDLVITLTLTPAATNTPTPSLARKSYLPLLVKPAPPTATPTSTPTPTWTPTATSSATYTPTVSPVNVRVAPWCCQFDAPGNDNQNLNEEYVCFENRGGHAADMSGWYVRDAVNTTYTFPVFTLAPGASVRLHTGSGNDTATDLYWRRGSAVWNNDGDTVYLYDAAWNLVDAYSY